MQDFSNVCEDTIGLSILPEKYDDCSASNLRIFVSTIADCNKNELMRKSQQKFLSRHGACSDNGGQRAHIRINQAKAYCNFLKLPLNLAENKGVYPCGINTCKSLAFIASRIPTPKSFSNLTLEVFETDVPILLELDALNKFGLYYNNIEDILLFLATKLEITLYP